MISEEYILAVLEVDVSAVKTAILNITFNPPI
jgi:hypothetical protein